MRDIKFRAWDKKEMWHFDFKTLLSEGYHGGAIDFDEMEIMQFTGLKDRNGVEIYEGDILEREITDRHYTVVWYESDMSCGWKRMRGESLTDIGSEHSGLSVIGNVYQNPELLETI